LPFFYGGQAVIEGVMMRGPETWAVAARRPDGGISLRHDPLVSSVYRAPFFKLPLVRGVVGLYEAMHLGGTAMIWAANVKANAEDIEISPRVVGITIFFSLCFSVALFFGLPLLVGGAAARHHGSLVFTAVEGATRAFLLVAYLFLISLIPDVKRLFMYHGAEHKTINAFEAGAALSVEAIRPQSRLHPRCGTGFLVVVVAVSIVVFTFVGRPALPLLLASRVVFVPVIAAVAYEFIRLGARFRSNPVVGRLLVIPMAAQYLTTREPDDDMIEVSLTAFKAVRSGRPGGDAPDTVEDLVV
jgi:uncharacterized protein YqhQ